MDRFLRGFLVLAMTTALVLPAGMLHVATAHKGAKGIVKQRMMAMKSLQDGMKALAAMKRGKAPFQAKKVREIATSMKAHAVAMPEQFPKGSNKAPSEATPAIWQDWTKFQAIAGELEKYAGELAEEAGQQPATAFGLLSKIGGTCSGCHKGFREEKK